MELESTAKIQISDLFNCITDVLPQQVIHRAAKRTVSNEETAHIAFVLVFNRQKTSP
jgi:hypothetical protein